MKRSGASAIFPEPDFAFIMPEVTSLPLPCAGGLLLKGDCNFEVINPATEKPFAVCPLSGPAEIDAAVLAASAAFKEFSKSSFRERRELLVACARRVRESSEEIAHLLTFEHGKPLKNARWEVNFAADWFEKIAAFPLQSFPDGIEAECYVETRLEPAGVIAGIVPWNFPVKLAVWKLAAALLMGNTAVIKPSPYTPLSTLKLVEILQDVLPRGVVNSVSGASDTGRMLCEHPAVKKVSFTGSVAVGRHVGLRALQDMKMVTLELGGNDAAIVLPDVDVKEVAPRIFWSAFSNLGQTCTSIKRLYVAASIHDQIVEELCTVASNVRLGDGFEPTSDLGPINNLQQLSRIISLTEDARARGGRVVCGGTRLARSGYFFPPTIMVDVPEAASLVSEEQFGPVLPIQKFNDLDEAVELANSVEYALGGSVWTQDETAAELVVSSLECGTCWINWHGPVFHSYPFGGRKLSGFGYEHGLIGLLSYCSPKVVSRHRPPSRS